MVEIVKMVEKKLLAAVEKMVGAAAKKKKTRLSAEAYRLIILLILAMLLTAACSNPIANQETIDSAKNIAVEAVEETGSIVAEVVESDDQTAENQGVETQADKIETPVEEPTVSAEAVAAPETPAINAYSDAIETPDKEEGKAAAETVAPTQETDEAAIEANEAATQEASSNYGIVDYSETSRKSRAEDSTNSTNESIETEPTETQPVETEEPPAATTENAGLSLEAAQALNPNIERIASGGTQYGFDSNGGLVAVFNQETNKWEEIGIPIDQIEEVSASAPNWTGGFAISATVGKLYIPENGKDLGNGNTSLVMVDVLAVIDGKLQVGQVSLVTKNQAGEFMSGKDKWPATFDLWQPEHWLGGIAKSYWYEHTTEEEKASGLYDDIDIRAGEGIDAYILDYFNPERNMPRITPGDRLILSLKPVGVELPSNPKTETAEEGMTYHDYKVFYEFWGPNYEDPRINQFMNKNDFGIFDNGSGEIPTIPSYLVDFYEDKDHQK